MPPGLPAHPPAIFLLGPTASGKTDLACHLSTHFPVELISVDSALIYRDMNIGTAKPDRSTLQRFPHALIDILSPEESYSAARFRTDALDEMRAIASRGNIPLLVGGTMLYFKALSEGLADLPQANTEIRTRIDEEAATKGWPALHAQLMQIDPASAAQLQPTDAQRIQRALEIFYISGQTRSALLAATKTSNEGLPYRTLTIGLLPADRLVLHQKIARRFSEMLREGLIEEVENLRARYRLSPEHPSMRCVGYRQVWEMQEGLIPRSELEDRGIFATRQLAKRQITWLLNTLLPNLGGERFDCLASDLHQQVVARVDEFLAGSPAGKS